MNTLTKQKKIIYSFILLIIFWLTLLVVPILNTASDSRLINHLPSGTNTVIKLNNRQILKRFIFDALFSSDFNQNELDQLHFNKKDFKVPNSGINITEDIYMFQDRLKNEEITGFLFHLNSIQDFSNFELNNKNTVKTFNDEVGCILLIPKESSQKSIEYYELYASDLLKANTDKLKAKLILDKTKENSLFHLYFAGSSQSYVQDLSLEASINKSTIYFEGVGVKNPTISYDSVEHSMMPNSGQETFLEIQIGQLPDSVYSYIDILLQDFKLELPHIISQQVYIYGFMIDNLDGATAFLPKFDGILRFNEKINLAEKVDSLCLSGQKITRIDSSAIKIGQITYYFKQITDKEIWIGVTKDLAIESQEGAPLPRLRGNPAASLAIEGKGIIAQFAQMLPPVQYSKKLFNDLEYFDIHTEIVSEDSLKVFGEMRFPQHKSASMELFKFMLKF
ncbi:MAG: hypothetical protein WEA99_07710 [Brumimicrobium sp.]